MGGLALSKWAGLFIVCVFLLAGLAAFTVSRLDPIRQYFNSDGALQLRGKIDNELFHYLTHGPPVQTQVRQIVWTGPPGATMSWREEVLDVGTSASAPPVLRPIPSPDWGRVLGDTAHLVRTLLLIPWNFLTGDASAACTGAACFWIGGTGNFSDTAHWSLTSGGAACTCTPGNTDSVTFDANSGAGTATQNNGTFTSGAVVMTNSSVTITGSNNLWKVGGNWSDVNGHFAVSTSTVEFTADATVTTLNSSGDIQFYNVTVDAGKTATVASSVGIQNVITVNGTWTQNTAGQTLYIRDDAGGGTPMVIGSSGHINGTTNTVTIYFFIQSGTITHIPGKTYTNVRLRFYPQPTVSGLGFEFRFDGAVSAASLQFYGHASSPYFVNSQTFGVTLSGDSNGDCIDDANIAATAYGITATSGAWALNCTAGGIKMTAASSSTFYIQFGTSVWTLDGPLDLNVVTSTTNWLVGTGTFKFYSTAASVNPVFPNFSSAANFANNLTFNCNNAGSCVYTLTTNPVSVLGAFSVLDAANASIFTTSTLGVTAGSVTVGAFGTLNQASATFVVVSGWDTSAGTYNYTTGLITFAGTGTIKTVGSTGSATMYAVSILGGATATVDGSGIGIATSLTIEGTLTLNGAVYLRNESGSNTPLAFVGSGAMTTVSIEESLVFFDQAGTRTNIPSKTYTRILFVFSPNVTVSGDGYEYRLLGNLTVATLLYAQRSSKPLFFNAQTYSVTLNGTSCLFDQPVGAASIGLKITSGTWTLSCPSGGVVVQSASSTFYIQFGSSSWTVNGPWILTAPLDGTKWNASTSSVTFNSTSSVITINPGALTSVPHFNDLTITTSYAALNNEVLAGNLVVGGLLHIFGNTGVSTATLDTSLGGHYAVTVARLQIDAYGHIQPRTSVVTITGTTWTTTNGASETSDCNAAYCFGGLSTVVFANAAGTTFSVADPNSYSETYWNVKIASGAAVTLSTDMLVLNQVTVGVTTGATLHLTTHVVAMKGDVPQVLTINGTSVFDNTNASGGLAFNSVNGPELVPGYNYGAITLFFYASSNVFNPAATNYQRLTGDVTTTGACYVYSFFVGPTTKHFLDLSGKTLTCGTLGLGTPPFGQAAATPYIWGGTGTVVVNGDVTVGTTSPSAYIDFGSSVWHVHGNWTNVSTSTAWVASATATVMFDGTGTQTIASGGNPFPRIVVSGATKTFTQSFTDYGLSTVGAVTVVVNTGIIWTHSGIISGTSGSQLLTMRSSTLGTQWRINVTADIVASAVDVQDSNASHTIIVCDGISVNSGNNTLWTFTSACPNTVYITQVFNLTILLGFLVLLSMMVGAAWLFKQKRDGGL